MNTYLGMDYGGTKLIIGEVREDGELLRYRRYPTGLTGQEEIAAHLLQCLDNYVAEEAPGDRIRGAGIGIVGISDFRNGIWHSVNHEKGIPIPLAQMAADRLGVPAGIDNDVRSAATAELLWGEGKNCSDFIYVNAGTGLAAGFVIDGKVLHGAHCDAGEIGHMVVDYRSSRECVCGRRGCCELTASGIGIHKIVKERQAEAPAELLELGRNGRYPAAAVFRMAREGNDFCLSIAKEAAAVLSCTIMNLVRMSDPDMVVAGGGLMSDLWFFQQVENLLEKVTMRHVSKGFRVSGFDAAFSGVIGAAAVGCLKAEQLEKGTNKQHLMTGE